MRVFRSALSVTLVALFILAAGAAMSDARSTGQSPWVLFEILDVRVSYQDISYNRIIYTDSPPPRITEFDMASGESRLLEEFHPCGVAQDVRIEGEWLVAEFLCSLAGETLFQSHVFNLETGETFLLVPNPPVAELPYSWYADIHDNRVVWSQLADCSTGDIYMLDLETRDLTRVTDGPDGRAKVDLHLGPEWLVWDEINGAEDRVVSLRGANLVTSQTITLTQGQKALGYMPLSGNGSIVWNETISGDSRIWAYDLESQSSHQISTSGRYPYAADLSGDLLLITEEIDGLADAPADNQGGLPNEPCEHHRPYSSSKNRVRVYDLISSNDDFVYYNPEANSEYRARIDGQTAIWVERVNVDSWHVLAARRLDHQYYMPLIFH